MENEVKVIHNQLGCSEEERYIFKNQKKMRFGYTTGSCATAASKAATYMLLTKKKI